MSRKETQNAEKNPTKIILCLGLCLANQSNAGKITAIVDKYLGRGKKVGECTPEQAEQIDLIVHDLELLIKG